MQFTLGSLFYVVTAICTYLTVAVLTADDYPTNDSVCKAVLVVMAFIGLLLAGRRRRQGRG